MSTLLTHWATHNWFCTSWNVRRRTKIKFTFLFTLYIFLFAFDHVQLRLDIKQTLNNTEKISMVPCKDDTQNRREATQTKMLCYSLSEHWCFFAHSGRSHLGFYIGADPNTNKQRQKHPIGRYQHCSH